MEQDGNVPESRAGLVFSGIWRGGLDLNASSEGFALELQTVHHDS
jgi:hypothetical protein